MSTVENDTYKYLKQIDENQAYDDLFEEMWNSPEYYPYNENNIQSCIFDMMQAWFDEPNSVIFKRFCQGVLSNDPKAVLYAIYDEIDGQLADNIEYDISEMKRNAEIERDLARLGSPLDLFY